LNLLAIALGGAIGSVARYVLSTFVLRVSGTLFPLGTFVVNVVGCLVFGAIAGASSQRVQISSTTRLFLLTGILGGFTTFSAFSLDTALLMERHAYRLAAAYVAVSVAVSLAALFAALAIFHTESFIP